MFTATAVFFIIGFIAQFIDGALGMAYGIICMSALLSLGVPPVTATASVHTAEVVCTVASGISHIASRNIDRRLVLSLVFPGVLGAVAGSLLVVFIPVQVVRPAVAVYLMGMAVVIVGKALRRAQPAAGGTPAAGGPPVAGLALAGGFFDAAGGGGWGPIVSSTLLARGNIPRYAIGSVSVAEFFVAASTSATLLFTSDFAQCRYVILGLVLGGVVAAPLAAITCRRLPARTILLLVGALVFALGLRAVLQEYGR